MGVCLELDRMMTQLDDRVFMLSSQSEEDHTRSQRKILFSQTASKMKNAASMAALNLSCAYTSLVNASTESLAKSEKIQSPICVYKATQEEVKLQLDSNT